MRFLQGNCIIWMKYYCRETDFLLVPGIHIAWNWSSRYPHVYPSNLLVLKELIFPVIFIFYLFFFISVCLSGLKVLEQWPSVSSAEASLHTHQYRELIFSHSFLLRENKVVMWDEHMKILKIKWKLCFFISIYVYILLKENRKNNYLLEVVSLFFFSFYITLLFLYSYSSTFSYPLFLLTLIFNLFFLVYQPKLEKQPKEQSNNHILFGVAGHHIFHKL